MAKLTPNATATVLGVTINEKIIPDGTVWTNAAGAAAAKCALGTLYKKQQKLNKGTGKPTSVTIHNTNDLDNVYDDGEQYTRATYNQNMKTARVHYYVDDTCAWQNLRAGTGLFKADPVGSAEVSWHSGDGSVADGGNMTSLSIEVIMDETPETDAKAYDNGARLAAWLLHKHGLTINDLVTHTYWVNKTSGKTFYDRDTQSTNPIQNQKWCPTYIFGSSNKSTAKKNWQAFKAVVQKYLDELNGKEDIPTIPAEMKPAVDTSKLTAISGKAVATKEQMKAYAKKIGMPDFVQDIISYYVNEAAVEGIRGDIAFAQSCLETGNFRFSGSAVTANQNNFCGMGVTSNGMKGNSFETPKLGIRAQVQHLKAYANKEELNQDCIDPRFKYVERGSAQYAEWLGQKENPNGKGWATGAGYGEKILKILNAILSVTDTATTTTPNTTPVPAPSTKDEMYRVRKTWSDSKSQLGAYKNIVNARAVADKNPGYFVFNDAGVAIYPAQQSTAAKPVDTSFQVKVDIANLNIRAEASSSSTSRGFTGIGVFTILEVKQGPGSKEGWGRLKSGAGWISLDYAKRV